MALSPTSSRSTSGSSSSGGLTPTAVKTTTYSAAAGDLVRCDATSAGFTVNLPSNPAAGTLVGVVKTDVSANVITVTPAGGGTVDGDAGGASVTTQWAGGTLCHIGSNAWVIVSSYQTTGPAGPTGPTGPTGGSGEQPMMTPAMIGRWYPATGLDDTGFGGRAAVVNTLYLGLPIIVPYSVTIDQLGVYVGSVGGVGSVCRAGIYLPSNQSNPFDVTLSSAYATLLAELSATLDTRSATGAVTGSFSSAQVLTTGQAFCVGVVAQVGTAPNLDFTSYSVQGGPWGATSILNGANLCLTQTGVSGALPGTFTPGSTSGVGVGFGGAGWFHRSA